MNLDDLHPLWNCRGRIRISGEFVRQQPGGLVHVFSRLVVLRCEYHAIDDTFRYDALSPEFDSIDHGDPIPEYGVLLTEVDGEVEVKFYPEPDVASIVLDDLLNQHFEGEP